MSVYARALFFTASKKINYWRYFSIMGQNSFSFCSKISAWYGLDTVPIFLLNDDSRSMSFGRLTLNRLWSVRGWRRLRRSFNLSDVSTTTESPVLQFIWLGSNNCEWLYWSPFMFSLASCCGGTERSDISRCGQLKDLCRLSLFAVNNWWFRLPERRFHNRSNVLPNTFCKQES